MIFSFHVGLTDSMMQRMQLFFSVSACSTYSCHRNARFIIIIFVRKYWVIQNDCGQEWQLCTKIYVATVWVG
jgi:hypothetical protein